MEEDERKGTFCAGGESDLSLSEGLRLLGFDMYSSALQHRMTVSYMNLRTYNFDCIRRGI